MKINLYYFNSIIYIFLKLLKFFLSIALYETRYKFCFRFLCQIIQFLRYLLFFAPVQCHPLEMNKLWQMRYFLSFVFREECSKLTLAAKKIIHVTKNKYDACLFKILSEYVFFLVLCLLWIILQMEAASKEHYSCYWRKLNGLWQISLFFFN